MILVMGSTQMFLKSRRKISLPFLLILLISLFLLPANAAEGELSARVVDVIDGDTVVVKIHGILERLRYLGIDTPELHHPERGMEELGIDAFVANRELVLNRTVTLEFDVVRRDKYGRLLAYVWLMDGNTPCMVNEELVRSGYALPLTIPPNLKYSELISRGLSLARTEKNGFWKFAEKRVYSGTQAWEELSYIRGHFITLEMAIKKVLLQKDRRVLLDRNGKCSLIIYNSDWDEFRKQNMKVLYDPQTIN
ncbi:MAG TPA: thermonuclease family protein [Synergistales bacterium]|nr:thermonuclease family protein [Synergistales bacterium]